MGEKLVCTPENARKVSEGSVEVFRDRKLEEMNVVFDFSQGES